MMNDRNLPGYRGDLGQKRQDHRGGDEDRRTTRTYISGKWHVTPKIQRGVPPRHNWPRQRGFDRFLRDHSRGG